MVLLTEQVRVLASEENTINDPTTYSWATNGWGTVHNYGDLVLSSATLIVFTFICSASYGAVRLKVGSYYVFAKYAGAALGGTYTGIAYIPAGTHTILVEGYYSGSEIRVLNFQLGVAKFVDEAGSTLGTYSSQRNVTVASRTTPIGVLKNAVFMVRCYGITSSQTNFENVGETLTNGVSLYVDGAQVSWVERNQDTGGNKGASAYAMCSLPVGSSHSFTISKRYAGTTVHVSIYACPWLLSDVNSEPVAASFPQGSTLYIMLEPLNLNPTKTAMVGKKRAVSFGDGTDYYSTSSGAGLLNFNYTFDAISVSDVSLYLAGLGGCVGYIGVDVR